jgi:hypothetical protein
MWNIFGSNKRVIKTTILNSVTKNENTENRSTSESACKSLNHKMVSLSRWLYTQQYCRTLSTSLGSTQVCMMNYWIKALLRGWKNAAVISVQNLTVNALVSHGPFPSYVGNLWASPPQLRPPAPRKERHRHRQAWPLTYRGHFRTSLPPGTLPGFTPHSCFLRGFWPLGL